LIRGNLLKGGKNLRDQFGEARADSPGLEGLRAVGAQIRDRKKENIGEKNHIRKKKGRQANILEKKQWANI